MILQVLSDPCWTVRLTVIHRHKNGGYFFDLAAGLSICSTMESEIIGNITKMARNLLRFHIVWCFLSFSVSVGFVRLYYTYAVWHQLSRHKVLFGRKFIAYTHCIVFSVIFSNWLFRRYAVFKTNNVQIHIYIYRLAQGILKKWVHTE